MNKGLAATLLHICVEPITFEELESLVSLTRCLELEPVSLSVLVVSKLPEQILVLIEEVLEDPKLSDFLKTLVRGNVLMAISNRFGHLLLSTGNKSEIAVGYCTLYGDMSGGLAAISDVPKTMVYRLAEQINRNGEIIPAEIITRPPSAELKPDQKDQDTLPPYDVLDSILPHYVEEGLSAGEIVDLGLDADIVNWVARAVKRNEYKRKQVPPGIKVTTKAFGMGRRMPIAARYED